MTQTIIDLTRGSAKDAALEAMLLKGHVGKPYGVALVMVIQDARACVLDVIESAIQQPLVHQVILVDNGNPADIRAALRKLENEHSCVRVIQKDQPLPQARVLNQAFNQLNQPYVLVVDQYHRLMDNATWRMLVAAQTLTGSWVMGVKRQAVSGRDLPSCTYLPTPIEAAKQLLGIRPNPSIAVARMSGLQPYHVPAVNSACVFMPADVCAKQMWNEDTTIWGGYTDFCMSVHQKQGNVYYLPEVKTTEIATRKPHWKYQLQSARGLMTYFNKHHGHVSRVVRWPLMAMLAVYCVLSPRWQARKAQPA